MKNTLQKKINEIIYFSDYKEDEPRGRITGTCSGFTFDQLNQLAELLNTRQINLEGERTGYCSTCEDVGVGLVIDGVDFSKFPK